LVGALALTTALAPIAPVAAAAPAPMPPGVAKAETHSTVVEVGRRHHRHHHHGHGGRNIGIGIGLGIIGGMIAAEAARGASGYDDEDVYDAPPPGASGDPRELCAREFRSFEWSTGLYTTFAGERKLCPYLR
jgi:hypothetical protein